MEAADGLILFAHGARDMRWRTPFDRLAQMVEAQRPDLPMRLAFLEFMQPGLIDAGDQLVALGCRHVTVVPMFLGAGGHVRRDLPSLLDSLKQRHPGVQWSLRPAIGEADSVIDAMAAEAATALRP